MIRTSVFEDEITLYWDYQAGLPEGGFYRVLRDGGEVCRVPSTHATVSGLAPDTAYLFRVEMCRADGSLYRVFEERRVATAPRRLRHNVLDYGAVGDGETLCTAALQRAIDACGKGETVYFPAGTYRSGALFLHSDMELYLDEGAVLQGSVDPTDYLPKIPSRFEGIEGACYASLINIGTLVSGGGSYNCKNVVLRGHGTIFGGGLALADATCAYEYSQRKEEFDALRPAVGDDQAERVLPGRSRGRLLHICCAEHVVMAGLTLGYGPSWNIHMIYSRDILTYNCNIESHDVWNGDGWDPDSSEDCCCFGVLFNTGDDSVAIKSGKNPEGNRLGIETRNIRIFDCKCTDGHGLSIGSEMSGGVDLVYLWDCDFVNSMNGIQIKGTAKRGGYIRRVYANRCRVSCLLLQSVGYNDDGEAAPDKPVFEDCVFEDVTISGVWSWNGKLHPREAIKICGFDDDPHAARNIVIRRAVILPPVDGTPLQSVSLRYCRGVTLEDIRCL